MATQRKHNTKKNKIIDKTVKFDFVTRNTKHKKGDYITIKSRGIRREYKIKTGDEIQPFLNYFKDRYLKQKPKGTLKQYKEASVPYQRVKSPTTQHIRRNIQQQRKRLLKKYPAVEQTFTRGVSSSKIPDLAHASFSQINNAKLKLLSPLVKDKTLLSILLRDENVQKFKEKINGQLVFFDEKNEVIAKCQTFNMSPEEIQFQLNRLLDWYPESTSGFMKTMQVNLGPGKSYTPTVKRIARVDLELIFRSG